MTISPCWRVALIALACLPFAASSAGTLSVTPVSLAFGGQSMGTTSPAQQLTLTNAGVGTLTITSITTSAQYAQTSSCPPLVPGASCSVAVTFKPAPTGAALNGTSSVNGTLTIQSNGSGSPNVVNLSGMGEKSLVTHYYRSILRRAPDTGGLQYWHAEAARLAGLGANVNEAWFALAQTFYTSPEYAAFNRDATGFVTDLYATFFNRAPDSGGLDYWVSQMNQGLPRQVALVSFMFSPEFSAFTQAIFGNTAARAEVDTVVDFYRGLLSRLPDSGGFEYWVGEFRQAQCQGAGAVYGIVDAISSAYLNSPEYGLRNRSNAEFVGDMYNAFMRRGGDLGGVQYWIGQLDTGARTRESVRQAFISTPEFSARVQAIIAQSCRGPSVSAHPRLWLSDSATISRLTASARANHPNWVALKSFCDTKAKPTFHYQGDEMYRYIANFSLCYRVVRALSGAAPAQPYAQKAVDLLQSSTYPVLNFTEYDTDSGYGIRNYVPAMALAYDWLHDSPLMTAAIKASIAARIRNWFDFYSAGGYGNGDFISNYNSGYMLARVLWAVAAYGEHANAATYWRNADAHLKGALRQFDDELPGGHWPEGWNYGAGVNERYAMAASAMKLFTTDSAYVSSSWMRGNVLMKMSSISPDGKFFVDDGTWSGDAVAVPSAIDAMVAGYALGWTSTEGKISRSYLNLHLTGGNSIVSEQWKVFLFYDTNSVALDLDTLPKSYRAAGSGVVTMRSDWSSAGGTWASLLSGGPYLSYQGQQDMDQGHIAIYRRAPLLIDVAHDLYGTVGQQDTVFHNTFTMDGRVDGSYTGQRNFTTTCPNPLGSNPIGNKAYSDGEAYAFTTGEFSAAYQITVADSSVDPCGRIPATWMARSVFYLRPGLFVLYDQIQKAADQSSLAATMHMHFPTAPVAADANRRLTVDSGGGRLHFNTVLPANSVNTVQFQARNTSTGPGVANHHLTVRYPEAGVAYQNFLSVLRAGDANASYAPPTTTAIFGTSAFGVFVEGLLASESATPVVVVFADNSTRSVPTSIQYSYNFSAPAYNYVAMLKPNTRYVTSTSVAGSVVTVTVTENEIGQLSDAAGVLGFAQ